MEKKENIDSLSKSSIFLWKICTVATNYALQVYATSLKIL
jgi:hypothetical protein